MKSSPSEPALRLRRSSWAVLHGAAEMGGGRKHTQATRHGRQLSERGITPACQTDVVDESVARRGSPGRLCLASEPQNSDAMVVKSALLLAQNQVPTAREQADGPSTRIPNRQTLTLCVVSLFVRARQPGEAINAFNEVLRLNPKAAAAQLQLARLHLASGASDASVALASAATRLEPQSVESRLVLARGLAQRGRLPSSRDRARWLRQASPVSAAVYAQIGSLRVLKKGSAKRNTHFPRRSVSTPCISMPLRASRF